ncbi:hypothetical protein E2C01_004369 [Portunus trituberculatus]|uniref:Uncharacterized protein n=1 Tax=Portunus trituberculatus TaxID=210409 RepID=A0A5B7CPP8_PORTR|nr:hypothetical protein [Portunus trituberculatus]
MQCAVYGVLKWPSGVWCSAIEVVVVLDKCAIHLSPPLLFLIDTLIDSRTLSWWEAVAPRRQLDGTCGPLLPSDTSHDHWGRV